MRGILDGLECAVPLAHQLPAIYQEDDFAQRLASAFDDSLAPVVATLDDLAAYVDAHLAPDDFLDWLASWVGVEMSDSWALERRRAVVAGAVTSYRRDGTAGGIAAAIALVTGREVELTESGGAVWSSTPNATLPGDTTAAMHVRITTDDPASLDLRRLDKFVAAVKPAHITHDIEVVAR